MDKEDVAFILARSGLGLFFVFSAIVVATLLPFRLTDPAWQVQVVAALINNAPTALVGLVFTWLATILFPGDGQLRLQRDRVAHLAVAAAIGFLLLIPLQGFAVWRGWRQASLTQHLQLKRATRGLNAIRLAVQEASSTEDLQRRLKVLQAPPLPPKAEARPIASLRPEILGNLSATEDRLRRRFVPPSTKKLWPVIKESVRIMVSALALATAFACGARWPGHEVNLLDSWLAGLDGLRWGMDQRNGSQGRQNRRGYDMDYLDQISGDKK